MEYKIERIDKNHKFLSEYIDRLPSNCLINKGITGCGGTTLELRSKRNSIILCPTINLVTSKTEGTNYFGVTGKVQEKEIKRYIDITSGYKKIVATYDALEKLMKAIPDYEDYFLLIDEYHLLFNDYSFRSEAILFILNNFSKFNDWAFLTASPLNPEFILKELQDIDQVVYEWENAIPVRITIKDTYFVQKELFSIFEEYKDRNFHVFLNSISTIYKITEKLQENDFRVVCSESSKTKIKGFSKITSPVKKYNFYTSCAFEGADIYDPKGYCIIVSDTNISTTVLDISTKIRQVCGRLRDSNYKDEVTLILNTNKHRYAGTTKTDFLEMVKDAEERGKSKEQAFIEESDFLKETDLRLYNKETYSALYLNKYKDRLYYDENLKKLDIYNYNLISEIYSSSISVLKEASKNNLKPIIAEQHNIRGLQWIIDILRKEDKTEWTYDELANLFEPLFKEHNLKWSKKSSISTFFPDFKKSRKRIDKILTTVYKFVI